MIFPIDANLSEEILKKYKPVAFRRVNHREFHLGLDGEVRIWDHAYQSDGFYLILEPIKQYREPVLPADAGRICEFSDDCFDWVRHILCGVSLNADRLYWHAGGHSYRHSRIEVTDEN